MPGEGHITRDGTETTCDLFAESSVTQKGNQPIKCFTPHTEKERATPVDSRERPFFLFKETYEFGMSVG